MLCRQEAWQFLIVGSGTEGFLLARALRYLAPGGRNLDRVAALIFQFEGATNAPNREAACRAEDVILTATPLTAPLIRADWVRPGCCVTAKGANNSRKKKLRAASTVRLPKPSRRCPCRCGRGAWSILITPAPWPTRS